MNGDSGAAAGLIFLAILVAFVSLFQRRWDPATRRWRDWCPDCGKWVTR